MTCLYDLLIAMLPAQILIVYKLAEQDLLNQLP